MHTFSLTHIFFPKTFCSSVLFYDTYKARGRDIRFPNDNCISCCSTILTSSLRSMTYLVVCCREFEDLPLALPQEVALVDGLAGGLAADAARAAGLIDAGSLAVGEEETVLEVISWLIMVRTLRRVREAFFGFLRLDCPCIIHVHMPYTY